jgi:predicted glycosyltransferase
MMSLMAACDVAVSMGGYNTVCELLTLRKRAVVVPRAQPGVEQTIRAERMAALGLLRAIDPDTLSPAVLLRAIQDELLAHARGEQRAHLGAMKGLDEVSQALLEWLDLDTSVLRKGRAPALNEPNASPRERPASFISLEKSWHPPISPPVGTLAC